MTRLSWVLRSLTYHRRIHIAVAFGVAAATAVLTGALLVGDSVRGSLRGLTLERLGKIEAILASDRFFRHELVSDLAGTPEFRKRFSVAAPGILFPQATIDRRHQDRTSRASAVLVLGCDESFWNLDLSGVRPTQLPADDEVILNETLATELNAGVGDTVTLRLPKSNQVPADSPLANKNDRIRSLPNLKVVALIPTRGLGRFNLQANQALPLNAFVSLGTLQDALEQTGKVNAIFVGAENSSRAEATEASAAGELSALLRPTLADFGIAVKQVTQEYREGNSARIAFEYFTVTTDRMIFDDRMMESLARAVQPLGGQPVLTYLANSIAKGEPLRRATTDPPPNGPAPQNNQPVAVPYSMVTAIDFSESFRLQGADGQPIGSLANDEIVLNAWTASDLGAAPGDRIRVSYFEPETTHGEAIERTAEFKLRGVATLTKPTRPFQRNRPAVFDQPPTAANDPDLTPTVKGVTDQDTIDDWDAPFPFDYKRVRKVDEDYWDFYRTTPKAFVSVDAGRRLWGSRFGKVTSFRVPARTGVSVETLQEALLAELSRDAVELGFQFIPVKQQQLAAARGTTPFDVLFLSLSFFVIAAALLMVALLFRLGIDQRAIEIGTLLAVGFSRQRLGRFFMMEGAAVAATGALLGVGVGVGYARLMLAGLSTWWVGAVSTPFLDFHWTTRSLVAGYGLGVASAIGTIYWAIRQTRRISTRSLLAGQTSESPWLPKNGTTEQANHKISWMRRLASRAAQRTPVTVPLAAAILLSFLATQLGGMAQAGAFVGGGAALLIVLLMWVRRRLQRDDRSSQPAWERSWILLALAERNAARNPGRSIITIGLMAMATFLIVAMSSFRLAPTQNGVGGFQFLAQSSEPIYEDLNDPGKRDELFGSQAKRLAGSSILGLRLRPGDDASCQNLYQSSHPRILGVMPQFIAHFDDPRAIPFSWASSAAEQPLDEVNPWRLLAGKPAADHAAVPVVLDKNTALYSLHLYRGVGEEFTFDYDGQKIRFRVVGLLENSVLQGSLLIGDADFRHRFPQISGFRYFLISLSGAQAAAVPATLEERFSDQGLDVIPALEVLEQLLAVQNTYLSTFQSLGALGLLLGAFGLATVQLRNVLERRGELALLQAVGYRRLRLAQLVMIENIVLLATGLLTGAVAALLAVLPHKLLGDSAVSWMVLRDLAMMLGAVFLAGFVSSLFTVRAVLRLPLLASLRGE